MQHPSIFTASWVGLLLLAVAISAISVFSGSRALRRTPDSIVSSYSVEQIEAVNREAADAVRGRRLTASSWALGCGLFLAFLVLVPYRRGERWAWWAILVAFGGVQLLSLMRLPIMGVRQGSEAPIYLLIFMFVALLLGAPRMFMSSKS